MIEDSSVNIKEREELLKHLAEREALLESRKMRKSPKPVKPNPKDIQPLMAVEVTMEDLRRQPGEKHWW